MRSVVLRDLHARGLVAEATNADELDRHLTEVVRTVYCGFDPTSDSLHIGSLVPLLALRRFQLAGHRPIVLIGGGTGLIGDPSGKATERQLNAKEQVEAWAERLRTQVARFLDFEGSGACRAETLDNYQWLSQLDVISFLRDVGKEFPVGAMLGRESVRSRLGRADIGLSYTEFSYQILQAYDFLELWRTRGCTIQLGGADQWGNITAGIDLIRRMTGGTAHGLTLPLVTKSDGSKFGKTEADNVWLDPARTSAYEMYQFWVNTADADAGRFLRYFTMLRLEDIADLEAELRRAPEKRGAQRALAREVTTLVHGRAACQEAEQISDSLFSGDVASLAEAQLEQALRGAPHTVELEAGTVATPLVEVLTATGLASSRRAARELITSGAVEVNGRRIEDVNATLSRGQALYGKYQVLRKGRRTYGFAIYRPAGA